MAQRTIKPALMATAAAALLALGSPLAHSAGGGGGGGVGLPFSVGNETTTRAAGWVPFAVATQRNTAEAELQRCQEQARGGSGEQNACSHDKSDKKADSRK